MHIDPGIALAGLFVGFTVGLTGMGGGALMTPILVLVFKVDPLAAVSSDVVAALVMKPIGGGVHLRKGTVNTTLVKWLCIGSVPSAFVGVLVLRSLGGGTDLQDNIKLVLGGALLLAAASITLKGLIASRRDTAYLASDARDVDVRWAPTLAIGIVGGLVVGMTSVGSGSVMIVLLLFLYPRLKASQLVGTDLVQAIPLVASAALGHLLFGDFQLAVTSSLLVGAVPGVFVGAHLSAQAPDRIVRPVLLFVLTASGLKLLGVANVPTALILGFLAAAAGTAAAVGRVRRRGVPSVVDQVGGGHGEVLEHPALDLGG